MLKFVIVGHVDHGKSTFIGRLLYDTDSVAPDKKEEVKKISKTLGREMEFAYLLDHLEEERSQGITIETTQVFFRTPKRQYVIIDAPGHVEFVKNMITGASQAEAAFLMVDVQEAVKEQTRRHAYFLSLLGIKQVIVLINKMDLADYRQDIFKNVSSEISKFLGQININAQYYIPISALKGENIVKKSRAMPWYDGPAVLEALDCLINRKLPEAEPFVLPVQDIYKIDDKRIAVGRIEAGVLNRNDEMVILPDKTAARVKSIEKFLENVDKAVTGESIGITTEEAVFINRGSIISQSAQTPIVSSLLKANIFWLSKIKFSKTDRLVLKCAVQEVSCQVETIYTRLNSSTLEVIESDAGELNNLETAKVLIKTKKPIAASVFEEFQELGRFVLVDGGGNTCAGGIITDVLI